jgi:hypothetical protein
MPRPSIGIQCPMPAQQSGETPLVSSRLLAACAALSLTCALAAAQEEPAPESAQKSSAPEDAPKTSAPAEWIGAQALGERLAALAAAHPELARVDTLGLSLSGRPILALVVRAGDLPLRDRQGLLLVGGLDGRRAGDANVLLAAAGALLADAAGDLRARLGDAAIVIVPRANPDGAEALAPPAPGVAQHEQAGNGRPDDRDRDGRVDEDGPVDLDGDGAIGWMAVPDGEGGWVFDEHDPRALRKARTGRGERGTHRLLLEGRDADGDGAENEDDTDGVQPDQNFPHGWREFAPEAGRYPLSEPESRVLADFVLSHPRLQGVLVLGGQDTLVALPKAAGNAPSGGNLSTALDGLHADDVAGLKELQRRLVELGKAQEHEHAVKGEGLAAGSFLAWTYHQAGRWPLALKSWAPPTELPKSDNAKADKAKRDDADGEPAKDEPAKDEPAKDEPAKDESAEDESAKDESAEDATAKGGRRTGGKTGKSDDDDKPTSDEDSPAPAAVLAWLTAERGGAGFLPWHDHAHEQLGTVRLGGLAPGTLFTASVDDVAALGRLLAPYTLTLLDCLPRVAFEDLSVTGSGGVAQVEVTLVNRGVLPTLTRLATLADLSRPMHVTLGLPAGAERLQGESHVLVDRLDGGGGRRTLRWVIAGTAGQVVTLGVQSASVPATSLEFTLP